jgi:hypothetical protein
MNGELVEVAAVTYGWAHMAGAWSTRARVRCRARDSSGAQSKQGGVDLIAQETLELPTSVEVVASSMASFRSDLLLLPPLAQSMASS